MQTLICPSIGFYGSVAPTKSPQIDLGELSGYDASPSCYGYGPLAQLVEQRTFNPLVPRSSRGRPTNFVVISPYINYLKNRITFKLIFESHLQSTI